MASSHSKPVRPDLPPADDAALLPSMWHAAAAVSGVGATVLISAAVAAPAPAWSQPGQVAPVTSHRAGPSRNAQHAASRQISSLCEGPGRPRHLLAAAGSLNVNSTAVGRSVSAPRAPRAPERAPAPFLLTHTFFSLILQTHSSRGAMPRRSRNPPTENKET